MATLPSSHALSLVKTHRYLRDAADSVLPGDTTEQAKTIVGCFFCMCAIAQTVFGPSFNPFSPVHKVLYTVTGVPDPDAVEEEEKDKSKED